MRKLISFFNHMLVVVPLGMASFLALVYLLGGWGQLFPRLSLEHFARPALNNWGLYLVTLILLALIAFCCLKVYEKIGNSKVSRRTKTFLVPLEIFLVAFVFRFSLVQIFHESLTPFSDFFRTWQLASGNTEEYLQYYTMFPAYLNYSVIETAIYNLFGGQYVAVLYINVILSSLTAPMIAGVAKEANLKGKIPFVAGLIYALMPANIAYVATGTPEFIVVFFNVAGIWFLLRVLQKAKGGARYLCWLVAGICLGIGGSYKSFAIVIVVAFAMVLIAKNIVDVGFGKCKEVLKRWLMVLLSIVLVFGAYTATTKAILKNTENHYGLSLSTKTALSHFLLVGLNTEGEGQIHLGTLSRLYWNTYRDTQDAELAKEVAQNALANDWSKNWKKLPKHFAKKMIWAWQDDVVPNIYLVDHSGVKASSTVEKLTLAFAKKAGFGVAEICYFTIMLTAAIGASVVSRKKEVNFCVEFLELIIFGYFVMIFIIEAQSRYKCLVMPFICIIAAIGVKFLWGKLRTKRQPKIPVH